MGDLTMASVLSLSEFLHRFPSEDECYEYLAKKRWPNGFRCPRCGHPTAYYLSARKKYQCINCRHQTSVTAGTVFHKLRQPLSKLFWAVYLIATTKKGISAMELQRKLGLKSYRTAWTLLHKIRVAMASSQAFPLTGTVEVDETYIGGRRPGKRGRGAEGKSLVAAAVETPGRSMGRAYLKTREDASTDSLQSFIKSYVTPGVTVSSDAFKSYTFLSLNYVHKPIARSRYSSDAESLPKIHIVIANLKMWLRGTYNCLPSKHLQKYLDEFTFRFNRRWKMDNIFDKLLDRCIVNHPCTYAELIA
jgi:transposase-like protein